MIESSLPQSEPVLLPGRSFGRQARSVIGYSLLTALMIVTPILVFVPAALLHCAIRNGRRAAWAVFVISVTLSALYFMAVPAPTPDAQKMVWSFLAGVTLSISLPSMAAVPLVERGERFARVLLFLLAGALIGLALTETLSQMFLSFSVYDAYVAQTKLANAQFLDFYRENGAPADAIRLAERWAGVNTFILPAQILILMSVIFALSLLMIGRLKAWREVTARRGDTDALGAYLFRNFSLPDWLLFAFIIGGLTPLATGVLQKIAANTLAVVVFLYILQGLAIFRFMLTAMGASMAGMLLGWTLLLFLMLTGVGPLLLGMAGLFDPFFDFRHFKKRKDDSHESHSD